MMTLRIPPASAVVFITATLLLTLPGTTTVVEARLNAFEQETYDMDTSWPTRTRDVSNLLGDKKGLYKHFIQTCKEAAGDRAHSICEAGDDFRMQMNTFQPMSMRNYTKMGFRKIKAPEGVFSRIKDFWEANKDGAKTEWHDLNTYHNMWEAPPDLCNIQDNHLPFGGAAVQAEIWEEARRVLEEWTGMHLAPCSMWGIRIYHNNSILATHVDRNPLVSSAIINVAQDVDEPWPLEVWGHDGLPYNVTMEPGDMVLYESHSILHGRPFPMRGRTFANIFLHFEPLGAYRKDPSDKSKPAIEYEYDPDAMESLDAGLPPYVIPGSVWEEQWHQQNPNGWELLFGNKGIAIQKGDFHTLENLFIKNPDAFHEPDSNGWYPIHEAARAGNTEVVKWLLERDADPGLVTHYGKGHTALQLVAEYHGTEHETYQLIKDYLDEEEL